jgi:hypothetical protein
MTLELWGYVAGLAVTYALAYSTGRVAGKQRGRADLLRELAQDPESLVRAAEKVHDARFAARHEEAKRRIGGIGR